MAVYIFDCPCCGERHVLNLAVVLQPTPDIDPRDLVVFQRVASKIVPKFQESEDYKKWQEKMA